MSIPLWTVNEVLTSNDVNTWFVPRAVVKASQTTRANTIAMTADPELSLPLDANATYQVSGILFYEGGSGVSEGDLKWTFTIPAGASGSYAMTRQSTANAFGTDQQFNWTDTNQAFTNGLGTILAVKFDGVLLVAATAGSLAVSWAQGASNATATKMDAPSFMTIRRIG